MNSIFSKILTTLALLLTLSLGAIAQPPPPPGEHGSNQNESPFQEANGPIGAGLAILLTLAAGYGAKKVYDARKQFK